jgi:hypothetical protein
VEEGKAER